jgi:A/G-specific adenine glycosylase
MSYKELNLDTLPLPDKVFTDRFRKEIIEWGKKNFAPFPWRITSSKFHALIAEVMLQRTRAEQVESVYRQFEVKYSTIKKAVNDLDGVYSLLIPLGLKWRAKKIVELIEELHRLGEIPSDLKGLMRLPGIGFYVASAFLSFHLGIRAVIVDNNIIRLYGRLRGFKTSPSSRRDRKLLRLADQMTPKRDFRSFNYAILDHARLICKMKPKCGECPVKYLCKYGQDVLRIMNMR